MNKPFLLFFCLIVFTSTTFAKPLHENQTKCGLSIKGEMGKMFGPIGVDVSYDSKKVKFKIMNYIQKNGENVPNEIKDVEITVQKNEVFCDSCSCTFKEKYKNTGQKTQLENLFMMVNKDSCEIKPSRIFKVNASTLTLDPVADLNPYYCDTMYP